MDENTEAINQAIADQWDLLHRARRTFQHCLRQVEFYGGVEQCPPEVVHRYNDTVRRIVGAKRALYRFREYTYNTTPDHDSREDDLI